MTIHCHTGESTDSIFTEQPSPLNLCIVNGKTIFLQWRVQYEPCEWPRTTVKTMRYTLYPNNVNLPIEIEKEVNVSVNDACNFGRTHINVTLSIHLNEFVLQHVPYLVCIITRYSDGGGTSYRSEELHIEAVRNCFITTTGKHVTDYDTTDVQLNATMETSASNETSSASCILHCNQSFIYVSYCYFLLCVFVIILLK